MFCILKPPKNCFYCLGFYITKYSVSPQLILEYLRKKRINILFKTSMNSNMTNINSYYIYLCFTFKHLYFAAQSFFIAFSTSLKVCTRNLQNYFSFLCRRDKPVCWVTALKTYKKIYQHHLLEYQSWHPANINGRWKSTIFKMGKKAWLGGRGERLKNNI